MTTDISAVMMLHNADKIRYPWRYGILSAVPVMDKIVVVVAAPDDDFTWGAVHYFREAFGLRSKLQIVNGVWPTSHAGLGNLITQGTAYCNTEWVYQLQGDEILDEADYPKWELFKALPDNVVGVDFGFRHYWGDFKHIGAFIYGAVDFDDKPLNQGYVRRVTRAFRTISDGRFIGDAAQAVVTGDRVDLGIVVHHVGKVHAGREREALVKEVDFQNTLYAHGKCWDGDIDARLRIMENTTGECDYFNLGDNIVEYSGYYPRYVREWAKELGQEL